MLGLHRNLALLRGWSAIISTNQLKHGPGFFQAEAAALLDTT